MECKALFIDGGTKTGVMQSVGEAVEGTMIPALGVVTWGAIRNRNSLVVPHGQQEETICDYVSTVGHQKCQNEKDMAAELDPNHTQFVLVDDGIGGYGAEIELRGTLEAKLVEALAKRISRPDIPIACVVIQGGPGTIDTVFAAVKNQTPVVVLDGTGQAAEMIAFAHHHVWRERCDCKSKEVLQGHWAHIQSLGKSKTEDIMTNIVSILRQWPCEKLSEKWVELFGRGDFNNRMASVLAVVCQHHFITVNELCKPGATEPESIPLSIKRAIVDYRLLSGKRHHVENVLDFLIRWKCPELWKHIEPTLKGTGPSIYSDLLTSKFFEALKFSSTEMAGLLAKKGAQIKIENSIELYSSPPSYLRRNGRLGEANEPATLEQILQTQREFLGSRFSGWFSNPQAEKTMPEKFTELLIWAAFFDHVELAKFLWQKTDNPVQSALIATRIWRGLSELEDDSIDSDKRERLAKAASEFEDFAIQTLDNLFRSNEFENDEKIARDMLLMPLPLWGDAQPHYSLLELAKDGKCSQFFASDCAVQALEARWYGRRVTLIDKSFTGETNTTKSPRLKYGRHRYLYFIFVLCFSLGLFFWNDLTGLRTDCSVFSLLTLRRLFVFALQLLVALFMLGYAKIERDQIEKDPRAWAESSANLYLDLPMILLYFSALLCLIPDLFLAFFWTISSCGIQDADIILQEPSLSIFSWVGRVLIAMTGLLVYARGVHFVVNKDNGALVASLYQMWEPIRVFSIVFLVCITSFGSVLHVLKPNDSISSFRALGFWFFRNAYMQGFGEVSDDYIQETENFGTFVGLAFLALFLLVSNVIVNLLVAMMGDVFEREKEKKTELFQGIFYQLCVEYEAEEVSFDPPPFNLSFVAPFQPVALSTLGLFFKVIGVFLTMPKFIGTRILYRTFSPKTAKNILEVLQSYGFWLSEEQAAKLYAPQVDKNTISLEELNERLHRARLVVLDESAERRSAELQAPDLATFATPIAGVQAANLPPPGSAAAGPAGAAELTKQMRESSETHLRVLNESLADFEARQLTKIDSIMKHMLETTTQADHEAVCQIGNSRVPVTAKASILSSDDFLLAVQSSMFKRWCDEICKASPEMVVERVEIQSVDVFNNRYISRRVGFIKLQAIVNNQQGQRLPGIVWMKGPAVGLLVLWECANRQYVLLTKQARVAAGRQMTELPIGAYTDTVGGQIDSHPVRMSAREELDKLGVNVSQGTINLTEWLGHSGGIFPSAFGCDEALHILLFKRTMQQEELEEKKELAQKHSSSWLSLIIVPLEEVVSRTEDGKVFCALFIYEQYKRLVQEQS
eukprot:TRINITY_DN11674_c0_g1_i3.p1 TRINITY_DN11674_c0_g1~~TRINITY_DN11674_c0_g1_i3.p1  ORF type:complete len:1459 (+),score=322.92 TRINITY_DN11674_c0_g1_i3:452-4378(+)